MPDSVSSKNIERAIVKGAKKVIAESGLHPSTRSGNKELSHWITSLSNQSFSSLQAAIVYGEDLGHKIVERSQAMNKTHLDRGVIRHLRLHSELPAIADIAASVSPTKTAKTSAQQVASQAVIPTASKDNSVKPAAEVATAFTETPSIEETMSESEAEPIVSIPVEPEAASAETAEVSDIEDSEPIPADTETAKVEIDPTPHIESAPEEPTSAVETVVAEEISATEEDDSEEAEDDDDDDDDDDDGDEEEEEEEEEQQI